MISEKDDHYFDESKELVGCNKSRYREFIGINRVIFRGWKLKQSYLRRSNNIRIRFLCIQRSLFSIDGRKESQGLPIIFAYSVVAINQTMKTNGYSEFDVESQSPDRTISSKENVGTGHR
jgi:hypothetical protein